MKSIYNASKLSRTIISFVVLLLTLAVFKNLKLIENTLINIPCQYTRILLVLIIPLGIIKLLELFYFVIHWFIKTWKENGRG